jgi:hypothetical protein
MMKFCTDDEVVKLTADLNNFKQNHKLNERLLSIILLIIFYMRTIFE